MTCVFNCKLKEYHHETSGLSVPSLELRSHLAPRILGPALVTASCVSPARRQMMRKTYVEKLLLMTEKC